MLNRSPLCWLCDRDDITRPGDSVHHIHPLATHLDLSFDPDNLAPACSSCHAMLSEMDAIEVIAQCRSLGAVLVSEGDNLGVRTAAPLTITFAVQAGL